MRYVSIDIETTGLNPEFCQILEFGAVIDNGQPLNRLPTFRRLLEHDRIRGEPSALAMNSKLLKEIHERPKGTIITRPDQLLWQFKNWLDANGFGTLAIHDLLVAGKNFASFDLQFIKRLEHYGDCVKFHHRFLDPSMLYLLPTDTAPPSTKTCYERAGLPPEVAHTAIEDALGVIKLLRTKGINAET